MADTRDINLDFYQLIPTNKDEEEREQNAKSFAETMKQLSESFTCKPLKRTDDNIYLFGPFVKKGGLIMGTLVRNQTNDIPPSFDGQNLAPLPFKGDEGLGYSTCFLYDPATNIVLIERPRGGVTVNALIKFLLFNIDLPKVEPAVVVNPVDLERFYRMNIITKFQVRIARVENGRILQGKGTKAVKQVAQSADDTRADKLEYSISAPAKKGLSLEKVRQMVSGFLKNNDDEEVEVLKVSGKVEEEGGSIHPIDFIQQRLRDKITVERKRLHGGFMVKEKQEQMHTVYGKHRQGLMGAYGKKFKE